MIAAVLRALEERRGSRKFGRDESDKGIGGALLSSLPSRLRIRVALQYEPALRQPA
jgi:hypothetical protein